MNADVYAKELLAAANIAGVKTEGSRECLSCVYIEFNEDGYSITSTDSFKLIHFENKHPRDYQDFSNMNAILIDAEFIKKNIKKTDGIIEIVADDYSTDVELIAHTKKGNRYGMKTERPTDKYVDYIRLFDTKEPNEPASCRSMNADYMADMCKAISTAYGKNWPVKIEFTDESYRPAPIHFTAFDDTNKGKCKGILMPLMQ